MSYPYVQSAVDLGPAQGPRLAMLWHMAEGGGTVAFLSKPNVRSVSVHFVIEYDGTIVQMLPLEHMHSSLLPTAIRNTNDPVPPDPPYGVTVARSVLGKWADTNTSLGPNHATIAVEVEGFAKVGPNTVQSIAIGRLAAYCGIPANLGHRDFADYKPCPGKHFPWSVVGGHGAVIVGGDMAINTRGMVIHTSHAVNLPVGTKIYDQAADGAKVLGTHGGAVDYIGTPAHGWKAVRVDLGNGSMIAYTTTAATIYAKPVPPDTGDEVHTVTLSIDGAKAYEVTV